MSKTPDKAENVIRGKPWRQAYGYGLIAALIAALLVPCGFFAAVIGANTAFVLTTVPAIFLASILSCFAVVGMLMIARGLMALGSLLVDLFSAKNDARDYNQSSVNFNGVVFYAGMLAVVAFGILAAINPLLVTGLLMNMLAILAVKSISAVSLAFNIGFLIGATVTFFCKVDKGQLLQIWQRPKKDVTPQAINSTPQVLRGGGGYTTTAISCGAGKQAVADDRWRPSL